MDRHLVAEHKQSTVGLAHEREFQALNLQNRGPRIGIRARGATLGVGRRCENLQAEWFSESRHFFTQWVQEDKKRNKRLLPWRCKERMRTVYVCLCMCLNIGVDPPDIIKTAPCARTECWIDPGKLAPQKALNTIGNELQKQYHRWQSRARYKQCLDPTIEDVRKMVLNLRRSARDDRVLFHFNGHGVPRPTHNGEVWVFNKNYTQYIPLSILDLSSWMSEPSIYVIDCCSAGRVIDAFRKAEAYRDQILQSERSEETEAPVEATVPDLRLSPGANVGSLGLGLATNTGRMSGSPAHKPKTPTAQPSTPPMAFSSSPGVAGLAPSLGYEKRPSAKPLPTPARQKALRDREARVEKERAFKCIVLASCGAEELLPMNPALPADLFTTCLTTPIKMALRWAAMHSLLSHVTPEAIDRIPGTKNDRKTPLGELNWIFTAITDTISWNTLEPDVFQRLFRQDLLVASLFRNFLLAERIMRSMHVSPVTRPALPAMHKHPLWTAWDLAAERVLRSLVEMLEMEQQGASPEDTPAVVHPSVTPVPRPLMSSTHNLATQSINLNGAIVGGQNTVPVILGTRSQLPVTANAYLVLPNKTNASTHTATGTAFPLQIQTSVTPVVSGVIQARPARSKEVSDVAQLFGKSEFFSDQLTAFEVWLEYGSETNKPSQLPIVLQVLLSQTHRFRALDLLLRFMDKGPWAVNLALSVGIFPYVLKLLAAHAGELKAKLVFIWCKILALENSCAADLLKDRNHKVFLERLGHDLSSMQRTMTLFCLSRICDRLPAGQHTVLNSGGLSTVKADLYHDNPIVRKWATLCVGKMCELSDDGKMAVLSDIAEEERSLWCAVRSTAATQPLQVLEITDPTGPAPGAESVLDALHRLLKDKFPEVRSAAAYAMGAFLGVCLDAGTMQQQSYDGMRRSGSSRSLDSPHGSVTSSAQFGGLVPEFVDVVVARWVARTASGDASGLVRRECVHALASMMFHQKAAFNNVQLMLKKEYKQRQAPSSPRATTATAAAIPRIPSLTQLSRSPSLESISSLSSSFLELPFPLHEEKAHNQESKSMHEILLDHRKLVWLTVTSLCRDPLTSVADLAVSLRSSVLQRVPAMSPSLQHRSMARARFLGGSGSPAGTGSGTGDGEAVGGLKRSTASQHLNSVVQRERRVSRAVAEQRFMDIGDTSRTLHQQELHQQRQVEQALQAYRRPQHFNRHKMGKLQYQTEKGGLPSNIQPRRDRVVPSESSEMVHSSSRSSMSSSALLNTASSRSKRSVDAREEDRTWKVPSSVFFQWSCEYFSQPLHGADEEGASVFSPLILRRKNTIASPYPLSHADTGKDTGWRTQGGASERVLPSWEVSQNVQCASAYMDRTREDRLLQFRYERNVSEIKRGRTLRVEGERPIHDQVAILHTDMRGVRALAFHPFEDMLVSVDFRNCLTVWNPVTHEKLNFFSNGNARGSQVTDVRWINNQNVSLLLTGSDDGCVRVWRNPHKQHRPSSDSAVSSLLPQAVREDNVSLTAGFSAMPHVRSGKKGVPQFVMDWQQSNGRLVTAGASEWVKLWELQQEQCTRTVHVGADTCVTSVQFCRGYHDQCVVSGCADGCVRLFDMRMRDGLVDTQPLHPDADAVHVRHLSSSLLLTADNNSNITLTDLRIPGIPISTAVLPQSAPPPLSCRTRQTLHGRSPLDALCVHKYAPLLATGSRDNFVKVFSLRSFMRDGSSTPAPKSSTATLRELNTIRYHDGFLGQSIGCVTALAFHPHRLLLAMGGPDNYVSIFSGEENTPRRFAEHLISPF